MIEGKLKGDLRRPWRQDYQSVKPRTSRDWAGDLARMFGDTRARVAVEEAPADSPLHEMGDTSFADRVAEARLAIIERQRERRN